MKTRKSYTSKGTGRNVAAATCRLMRESVTVLDKELFKRRAWKQGKNPWITIPGPATNMRFIRVRANTVWGDPKGRKDQDKQVND